MDITEALAAAKPPAKTIKICLRGDLAGEFEELEEQLEELSRAELSAPSLAGSGRREIAERMESLREQMLSESVEFHLRAMGRKAWQDLADSHPPRPDHDLDRMRGFNQDTFFPALIRASVSEPKLSDEQWAQVLDELLSPGQFEELAQAAWALNRRGADVPFSHAALQTLGRTGPDSRQPSDLE